MKILVTGAKGFVGKNLCWALKNIQAGKDKTHPALSIEAVYEYDLDSTPEQLEHWCKDCDFVFNLAGVNRPQNQEEFMQGNFGFASTLLDTLKKHGNKCPIMLSSSQQASLTGRFGNSEYGRSKKAGEDLFLQYEKEYLQAEADSSLPLREGSGVGLPRVLIYRFPNLFGKWCRPNYNSAVATFCNAFANDLPYTVNDPSVELELLYIDDLIDEMLAALEGHEHRCEFDGLEVVPYEEKDSSLFTLHSSLIPEGQLPPLPCLGITLKLPKELQNIEYLGRGPWDNYPDRHAAALVDIYKSTVSEQYFHYPRPQDSGNHDDVQWLKITDDKGHGWLIESLPSGGTGVGFSFSALPYSVQQLYNATHDYELKEEDCVWLNLDCAVMGLGNSSCGPGVLTKYAIPQRPHILRLRFTPL